jgi:hypothetical protein
MQPLVSIAIEGAARAFQPGDRLVAQFQIETPDDEPHSVEASVMWLTEGKGDEDFGVHFFQRFTRESTTAPLGELRQIAVSLPGSPLSYDGAIVKIRWCVRIRAFFSGGPEVMGEQWFQLGSTMPVVDNVRSAR